MLRKMEGKGRYETAKRLLSTCSQIFRYAIATARAERDIAADLRGALIAAQPSIGRRSRTAPKQARCGVLSKRPHADSQTWRGHDW